VLNRRAGARTENGRRKKKNGMDKNIEQRTRNTERTRKGMWEVFRSQYSVGLNTEHSLLISINFRN